MLNIRPIDEKDIEACKALVPANCDAPDWTKTALVERDGEIIGIGAVRLQPMLEPLYMKKPDAVAYLLLGWWLDSLLYAMGHSEYAIFVSNLFPAHQKFVEKHLKVEPLPELSDGKWYFKRRK